jgi:hypothetical protein
MLATLITALIFALICVVLWHLLRFVVQYAQASRAWADLLGVLLVLLGSSVRPPRAVVCVGAVMR